MEHKNIKYFYFCMLVGTIIICAFLGVGLNFVYNRYFKVYQFTPGIIVTPNKTFLKDDMLLGYKVNAGKYLIKIGTLEKNLPFNVTINNDGWRVTSYGKKSSKDKEIWVFGCSYTFGWSVNDNENYPWLLQEKLKDFYNVYNYSGNGYGNVQGLNQLKYLVAEGKHSNVTDVIAVFNYNRFHLMRNVATYSYLTSFTNMKNIDIHYVKASLDENNNLAVSVNPFFLVPAPDPSEEYMEKITKLVFDEVYKVCIENNIVPVVVYQHKDSDDAVLEYCRNKGFHIVDISVDNMKGNRYNNNPYDVHPNTLAHRIYFDKLYKAFQEKQLLKV